MDPSQLSPIISHFDLVVVDAPCSGSGLFRKQPEALEEWSPAAVDACRTRQKNILGHLVPDMKAGAFLFYSTCSYSTQENEEVVEWLQKEYGLQYKPLPIEKDWGIVDSGAGYRFYPDQTRSEGFFCALLQKSGEQDDRTQRRKEPAGNLKKEEHQIIMDFVGVKMEDLIQKNGFIYSMPEQVRRFLNAFEGRLYVRKAGLCLGELKGRDLVPAHELALSTGLLFRGECLELEKEEALRFLRKDVMAIGQQRKGFVKVNYKKQGIGWIKLLGNRVNNYLPNESRILKQE
jgi:NOL1/NOP2/fmu family ribosome biogenesis protein